MQEVAAAVGLSEGRRGVRAVLAALARLEPVSTRRLSRAVDLPVPIVASICGELRKRGVVSDVRPTQLTRLGRALFAAGALDLQRSATCPKCAGRGVVVRGEMSALLAEMHEIARAAPPPRLDLDQCHCTAETKLRRVLALHDADALVGRRVLLLGDDDLVSLAIDRVVRRFGSHASIARLAVVDVDPEVVDAARRALGEAPYPTSYVLHDLREPLPAELRRSFDTVVTDPPYTLEAAVLFLSRAVDALDGGGDVFFSFGSRRPGAGLLVQRAIGQMGFAIVRLLRDFNEYVGAGALGGASSLYHLSATSGLRPLVAGAFHGPLYTSETGGCVTGRDARSARRPLPARR
ncbi:MAG: bis-aminopropyl spermidine synthase family protein [Gaiellaceae bacterium]